MPQIINTNIMSLNTQRSLNKSQNALQTSLQRLSSGLRINSAKDDAAGLGISERMTTQIQGLSQAIRNSNDGVSLAQTTEGALAELTSNLQRIRELAVQAANATNSTSDRAALDQEVQQRLAEIDRIANQTSFNGRKMLDGTFGTATFQVGANVGETISLNLSSSMRTTDIGKTADYVGGTAYDSTLNIGQQGTGVDASNALASGDLTIAIGSGQAVSVPGSASYAGSATGQDSTSAYAKVAAINAAGVAGLTATADTTAVFDFSDITGNGDSTADNYSLTINGTAIYTTEDVDGGDLTGDEVAAAINANSSATGVTATYDSSAGTMTLQAVDGRDITISQTASTAAIQGEGFTTTPDASNNSVNDSIDLTTSDANAVTVTATGSIRLVASEAITIGGNNPGYAGFSTGSLALGNSALNSASVTTVSNAETTITRVDAALDTVTSLRGELGAIQNRFESVITNLESAVENLSAARSRIRDADYAAETATLTRNQIIQQAGIAMLSQANALPQQVLALLQ